MTDDPVRVSDLLRRSTACPRRASRPSSSTSPRCLEFRFYNRRFVSRALVETSPSETVCRASWENPPIFGLTDRPCSWRFRRSEDDAGPPCGHPASNGCALDGVLPASGRSTVTPHAMTHGVRGEGRCFIGWRRLCRIEPSGISRGGWLVAAEATFLPVDVALSHRGTSMRPMLLSPRCLPPEETTRALLRELDGERCSRRPTRATAARVHRCSRTSTRPLTTRFRA